MDDPRKPIFEFLRSQLKDGWTPPLIEGFHQQLDALGAPKAAEDAPQPAIGTVDPASPLTVRGALEIVSHEAIVQEAYQDSGGVWTWGIGVTNASGHEVFPRYKDNPQPIQQCLEVYIWLLRKNYIPDVLKAFAGRALTEAQFAAALSFHYNTGAIGKSDWVRLWLNGKAQDARQFLESHYLNGGVLTGRRKAESALFFDGQWSNNGRVSVFPVAKPSYHPDFRHGQRVDITADLAAAMAAAA